MRHALQVVDDEIADVKHKVATTKWKEASADKIPMNDVTIKKAIRDFRTFNTELATVKVFLHQRKRLADDYLIQNLRQNMDHLMRVLQAKNAEAFIWVNRDYWHK